MAGQRINRVEGKVQVVDEEGRGLKRKIAESWRMGFVKRKEDKERKAIARGGWAPEGSFEFEKDSKGVSLRCQIRDLADSCGRISCRCYEGENKG
jgi:hypothetical protein